MSDIYSVATASQYEEQLSIDEQGNPVSVLIQVPVTAPQTVQDVEPVVEKPVKAKSQTPAKTSTEVAD